MGEIAEATLAGLYCEGCGEAFPDMDEPGYPRRCASCRPSQSRKAKPARPIPPLRKQDRKWLEHVALLCKPGDDLEFVGGMYAGMTTDMLPGGPAHRLEARGAIVMEQPHNPIHKSRWVITDAGLADLKAPS